MAHYIIIGWPKCGTSSLYYYINDHPFAEECRVKETDFFEYWSVHPKVEQRLGHQYYASLFPVLYPPKVSGEATTKYSMDLQVPARIKESLPFVRLLVAFRNPPDQIYSNYLMTIRWITKHNAEPGAKQFALPPPFDQFINQGKKCFQDRPKKCSVAYAAQGNGPASRKPVDLYNWAGSLPAGNGNWPKIACTYQCKRLGDTIYADYMENWLDVFPIDQFAFVRTEELEKNGAAVMTEVSYHLYLPEHDYSQVLTKAVNTKKVPDIYNVTSREHMEKQKNVDEIDRPTRAWLTRFFYPHNFRLENMLQTEMRWDVESIFWDA